MIRMDRRKRYAVVGFAVIIVGALPAWRSFSASGSIVGMYVATMLTLAGLALILLPFLKNGKKSQIPVGRE
jgi:hypothetical protein